MRRRGTFYNVAIAIAMGASGGCELPPPDADIPAAADTDTTVAAYRFEEDDDPEVAALPFVETELLARVFPGAEEDDLRTAFADAGVARIGEIESLQTVVLAVPTGQLPIKATLLAANPLFESVHKSYLYEAESLPDDLDFDRQNHFATIGVDDAWNVTTGSDEIIIAVLDTGVEPDHPDLKPKLLPGWNIYDDNADSADVLGHGTAVAGSAAAVSDNRVGVAGVSWKSPILPVRISDPQGRADSRDVASGIIWAVRAGAKVINVSFAPLGSDRVVLNAAQFARNSGALVFISSGNAGKAYRARKTSRAVFVGAIDQPDQLAFFSNTGPFVDLVAPGVNVYTTLTGRRYGAVSGTSFASPIVAGVAALVWSVNPDFRPVTVEDLLFSTADDLGGRGRDNFYGVGRINAAEAVTAALDVIEEGDTQDPQVEIIEPRDRQTVSGVVRVTIGAFDRGGLADVVLFVDGTPFATDNIDPYRMAINTKKLSNGLHRLTATATDFIGNATTARTVRIIVEGGSSGGSAGGTSDGNSGTSAVDDIAPSAMFSFPADGTRVFSSVGIRAVVSDDTELRSIEWLVDGVRREAGTVTGRQDTVDFVWNAASAAGGTHVITLVVEDAARNQATASLTLVKD